MTIEQMNERKRELGYSYKKIAELSGVPLGTVQKVLSGITKAPRWQTLQALEKVLVPKWYDTITYLPPELFKEDPAAYGVAIPEKKPGEYTVEDYYAVPAQRRMELIDGVLYDVSAPSALHQLISGELFHMLRNEIGKRKGDCLPFAAPVDVQLDCDDRTMLQPDIFVVCDRSKVIYRCVFGAPDFVIEILSPSTRQHDMQRKAYKYANAGVREYWMVDPDARKILVYDYEHQELPQIYGFTDRIPVRSLGDGFYIDFSKIYEYISFFYGEENVIRET